MTEQFKDITEWKAALEPFTVKQIVRAFPGMPDTTAYSWKNSDRAPSAWLRPVLIERLKNVDPSATPEPDGSLPAWFLEWILNYSPVSVTKLEQGLNSMTQDLAGQIPAVMKAMLDDGLFEENVRLWVKEDAIRLNRDYSAKDDEPGPEMTPAPKPRPPAKSIFEEEQDESIK